MKVGDTLWRFDINRRRYPTGSGSTNATIYSEHFEAGTITAETPRSWLVGLPGSREPVKVNKATLVSSGSNSGRWFTEQGKADEIWAHENRPYVTAMVERAPASQLRHLATLIGYKERT